MSPIMETLTGIMIAFINFYSGKLMAQNELDINNFFSFFSCNDVGLSTSKIFSYFKYQLNQGLSGAKEFYQ